MIFHIDKVKKNIVFMLMIFTLCTVVLFNVPALSQEFTGTINSGSRDLLIENKMKISELDRRLIILELAAQEHQKAQETMTSVFLRIGKLEDHEAVGRYILGSLMTIMCGILVTTFAHVLSIRKKFIEMVASQTPTIITKEK